MKRDFQQPGGLSTNDPPRTTAAGAAALPGKTFPGRLARAFAILPYAAAVLWLAALAASSPSERQDLAVLGFLAMAGLCLFVCSSLRAMAAPCALAFVVLATLGPGRKTLNPEGLLEWIWLLGMSALTGCVLAYGLFSIRRFFAGSLAGLWRAVRAGAIHLRRGTARKAALDPAFALPVLVGAFTGAAVGLFPEALIRGHATLGAVLACAPLLPLVLYGRAAPATFVLRAAAYLAPLIGHGAWLGLAYGLLCYRPVLGPAMRHPRNRRPASNP